MYAYVARTKGAIGYVSADSNTDGVKTLAVVRGRRGRDKERLITRIEPEYPETLKRLNIGGTCACVSPFQPQAKSKTSNYSEEIRFSASLQSPQ